MKSPCVFCQIVEHQLPASIVEETDQLIVFNDINPQAPIHYLIVPKKHIADVSYFEPYDKELAGDVLLMAQKLSMIPGARDFKLICNNGIKAGQEVFHLHIHFLAGF